MNSTANVNTQQTHQLSLAEKLLANIHPENEILFRLQKCVGSVCKNLVCGYSRMHHKHNRS